VASAPSPEAEALKRWQDEFAQLAAGIGQDLSAAEPRLPPD